MNVYSKAEDRLLLFASDSSLARIAPFLSSREKTICADDG
jgi:hypothetical protein